MLSLYVYYRTCKVPLYCTHILPNGLGISERTVRFHLRNIYDKLGVQQRGEALAWAILHWSGRDT